MEWQYDLMIWSSDAVREEFLAVLNEKGRQGWEATSMCAHRWYDFGGATAGYVTSEVAVLLKRSTS